MVLSLVLIVMRISLIMFQLILYGDVVNLLFSFAFQAGLLPIIDLLSCDWVRSSSTKESFAFEILIITVGAVTHVFHGVT